MSKPVIGFIGVGLMGHGMAKNIVEAGYPLRIMAHRKREAVDDLIKRGAVEVTTPKEMAESVSSGMGLSGEQPWAGIRIVASTNCCFASM